MNLLTNNEANECVTLLINTLPACHFKNFIKCINNKDNWTAELCWCFFEMSNDDKEYYQFETFEDNSYKMLYDDFLDIVKLAIIRFYLGTDDVKTKESLKSYIKNTAFDSILDNIDPSSALDIPLIYGQ